MSKILLTIKEAKIINSQYSKPERRYDGNQFKSLNFDICPTLPKKNAQGEWESKLITIKCAIWNEDLANKFIDSFNDSAKNYITILNAQLSNFHAEQLQKISSNGNEYSVNAYSYISISISDFIITSKTMDDEPVNENEQLKEQGGKKDEPAGIKANYKIDEDVPF